MKIYDISQDVLSSIVFPGDPKPKKEAVYAISKGDVCNLTAFSMCAHNGTHIDAPRHFLENGKAVEEISLSKMVGYAYVVEHAGIVTESDALTILEKARQANAEASKKILIKGEATISNEAAKVFAYAEIDLIGNESQTIGPEDAPIEAHKALLSKEIVLLEGIRLKEVPQGVYFLSCAPLSISGADGSPCRAILVELPIC